MMAVELGEAFRRHRGTLTAAAMRVLRRHDDVDDVLQDAFIAALRAWLTRVTVRTARRRYARAWFVALEDAPAAAHVPDPRPSALDLALLAAVGEVVAAIPADRWRPWALRTVDGEPIDDIAACCGCSATTVKRRIAEVRGLLEAALE